ncbi:MAG: hypothetical protein M3Y58_15150 [Chloroflexota bacterium]|nr:hypothetical protein [Chloroflexota bacterium]
MAGVNQYRRRWSTQHQYRRSRTATVGRGLPLFVLVVVLAVTLYIFGIVGPDARRHIAIPTLSATLVPPPAALVVPTAIGEVEPFGTLPPVAPIMNGSPPPALIYKLTGPLTGGAPRADVFSIAWPPPSAAQVDELARKLGLTGPVRQPKAGMYTVDGNGTLSVDAQATVYTPPPATTQTNGLPDDRTAISSTRSWLSTHDLLPPDVGPATVRRNGDTLDVIFHPNALPVILSDLPGVRVRVGPGSVVQEVQRAWPSKLLPGAYDLISLDDAWQQAQTRGMVDFHPTAGRSAPPNTTALINSVSLAYAVASDQNGMDFLQPLYLFSGTVAIPGQPVGADIRIAVPAVRNVQQSAG